jgi:transcription elongation factor GreA
MAETVWLSQPAYERLQAELAHLKGPDREAKAKAIEIARSHGDLKENAEYDSAKEEQGKAEARIRQLDEMLRHAQVGEAPSGDTIAAGMVVTTVDSDGDAMTFLVGSIEDKQPGLSVVSPGSPLGRALLGHKAGDTVSYVAPAGTLEVTVREVKPLGS